jgi:succinoglycan biosynthesis protein ExoV
MDILYYKAPGGNFGDDLNGVIWQHLFSQTILKNDSAAILGIGSIFNDSCASIAQTKGKKVFVFGSGAGYAPLPSDWREWQILALRGPLTAALIERSELAVTDAAILVASTPLVPAPRRNRLTLFMPHHQSAAYGKWDEAASKAGLTYVDPRWQIQTILRYFSEADLVIAEAMHGAIVADALRIPWIPVSISPDNLSFKWWDWMLSLGMRYEPTRLPPSSLWEKIHHRVLEGRASSTSLRESTCFDEAELIADFKARYKPSPANESTGPEPQANTRKRLRPLLRSISNRCDWGFVEEAACSLRRLANVRPLLSLDEVFFRHLDALLLRRDQLEKVLSGS